MIKYPISQLPDESGMFTDLADVPPILLSSVLIFYSSVPNICKSSSSPTFICPLRYLDCLQFLWFTSSKSSVPMVLQAAIFNLFPQFGASLECRHWSFWGTRPHALNPAEILFISRIPSPSTVGLDILGHTVFENCPLFSFHFSRALFHYAFRGRK